MISRLKDGAVLIMCEESSVEEPEQITSYKLAVKSFLASNPDHGMIFNDGRVYHSSNGERQTGVRSHDINEYISTAKAPLGIMKVLQCRDEDLLQLFVATMARWDPVDFRAQLRAKPPTTRVTVKLPTPFMDFDERTSDPLEQSAKCECYRALRAYQRNTSKPLQPLSRKGVSCGNYVCYSFKAAIVDYLFPKGLPDEILKKIQQIEEARNKGNDRTKLKLFQVGEQYEYLDELMRLVEKHTTPDKKNYVDFLKIPVKSTSVDEFCAHALKFPDIWEFKGYMFFLKDAGSSIPYVMDYQTFMKVASQQEGSTPQNIVVTKDELAGMLDNKKTEPVQTKFQTTDATEPRPPGNQRGLFDNTRQSPQPAQTGPGGKRISMGGQRKK